MSRLEPLTSVRVVLLSATSDGIRDDYRVWIEIPQVVVILVSSYLDGAIPSRWSIQRAIETGFGLRMLKRLAVREELACASNAPKDPFYSAFLASKALVATVKRGDDVDVVRWICCEYCPSVVPVKAIAKAASLGRLRVLQWLSEQYPSVPLGYYVLKRAVCGGHLDVAVWISARFHGHLIDVKHLVRIATSGRHFDIVRWLHELHVPVDGGDHLGNEHKLRDHQALEIAITRSNFDIAKFLDEQGYKLDPMQSGRIALSARHGDLEMLQWLHGLGFTRNTSGWIEAAACSGCLHVVQWLHENAPNVVCDGHPIDWAASEGHLEVVEWLHEHRTEGCTTRAMDGAAAKGSLEVVQWLHEHRSEGCTHAAMDNAAANGHLDVVQWLHEHRTEGCTTRAMDQAAANSSLEVVRWLHKHRTEGCTTRAMDDAAAGGHLETVQWLHTHRSEGCTTDAMNAAANNRHLEVVKWLHAHRSEGCTAAAMNYTDSLSVLRWLHENRTEGCTRYATADAVLVGNFAKLLFLQEHHKLGELSTRSAAVALKHSHFEIYQWLRANFPACVGAPELTVEESVSKGTRQAMFACFESGNPDNNP